MRLEFQRNPHDGILRFFHDTFASFLIDECSSCGERKCHGKGREFEFGCRQNFG